MYARRPYIQTKKESLTSHPQGVYFGNRYAERVGPGLGVRARMERGGAGWSAYSKTFPHSG